MDVGRDPATGRRRQQTKGGFRTKKDADLGKRRSEGASERRFRRLLSPIC
ncbi:MAG: hypothetical protein AMXMBFR46_21320 [Acidimicrobiia bacterium]